MIQFIKVLCCFRLLDREESINGSKTQSSATTESNTPENTVRLENMGQKVLPNFHIENNEVVLESKLSCLLDLIIFLSECLLVEGIRESEIIKQAIGLGQIDNCDPDYMMQVLMNLMICIKNGNCELPIKNFK